MNRMTTYLSDKIKVISFIAITMVIYIHTYYTEGENYPVFMSIQQFLGGKGLSGTAVPLFYFISGYLLFLSVKSARECFPKIKKRIKTLLIPYVLANTIAFLMYSMLDAIASLSPTLYNVINFHILKYFSLNFFDILYNIYWTPVAFQLWFVRDMLIFVLFSPLVFYIIKYISQKKWSTILGLCTLSIIYFATNMHILFMAIGGIISISKYTDITDYKDDKLRNILMYISGSIFLSFVVLNTIIGVTLNYGYSLFGVVAIWLLYDKIVKGKILCKNKIVAKVCSYSFFIYLIHEPILLVFKKLPLLISSNEFTLTIYFLTVPLIFEVAMILFGNILRKYAPKAYSVYTGGR